MPLPRRSLLASALAAPAVAMAEEPFPNRPITFVLPLAPGGPGDTIGRPLAQWLQAELGQPVVIDNRPGAGGTIGVDLLARSRPDGHTLTIFSNSTYAIAPHLYPMPYDNETAYTGLALIAGAPSFVVVPASLPARTLAEFIALARQEPDRLAFATAGIGFTSHLASELFMARTGTRMLHVPYRGGAPASQAVVAGEVQMNFMEAAFTRSLLGSGRIRALAVSSRTRHPLLPEIPTIDESGVPGFETATYWAMAAPAGVPRPVFERLEGLLQRYMALASSREQLTNAGFLPIGGDAAAFARHKAADTALWGGVIRERGIRI